MPTLFDRLRTALVQGAALASATATAGCFESSTAAPPGGSSSNSTVAGTTAAGTTAPVAGGGAQQPTETEMAGRPSTRDPIGTPAPEPDAAASMPMADASTPTVPVVDASVLMPYPMDLVGCFGQDHPGPGYRGQCCVNVACYTPAAGEECAPQPTQLLPQPWGSGNCGCAGTVGADFDPDSLAGPFAPNPDDPEDRSGCCYLIARIACDGRPLIVGGVFVVAHVVTRADWALIV